MSDSGRQWSQALPRVQTFAQPRGLQGGWSFLLFCVRSRDRHLPRKALGFEQWHSSLQGTRAAGRVESSFGLSVRRRALWLSTLFLSPTSFSIFGLKMALSASRPPSTLVLRSRPRKYPDGRPHQWDGLEVQIALPFPSCGAGEEPRQGASSSRLPRTQRPALRPSEKPALPSAATGQAPRLSVLPAAALVTWASGTSF